MNRQFFGLSTLVAVLLALVTPTLANPRSAPCLISPEKIICSGSAITDASLLMLKDDLHTRHSGMLFLELHVSHTDISRISSGIFADVEFEHIYIQDNPYLTYIADDAFKRHKTNSLLISNNPLLKTNAVYRLADRLEVSEYVDFDFNALEEVPSNAFNEHLPPPGTFYASHKSHPGDPHHLVDQAVHLQAIIPNLSRKVIFTKVVLSNNKLQRINENAFHLMESCKEIYLNYNQISHISKHGFNLADHAAADQRLQIMLHHNKLTKDSFDPDFIMLNDRTHLILDLSNNQITELRKDVFKPLLEKKTILLDLSNNPLDCNSEEVTWLKQDPKIFVKTKGVNC